MSTEETIAVETDGVEEKPKKGLKVMLIVIGLIAVVQCVALFVIFQDEITSALESLAPEPVEVVLYQPLDPMSMNLADKHAKHFLKATVTLEYNDESLTPVLVEKLDDVKATVLEVLRSKTYEEVNTVENTKRLAEDIILALNESLETEGFTNAHFTDYLYQ